MTITAKYAGRCAVCGQAFAAGSKIEWSKGSAAKHTTCTTTTTTPAMHPNLFRDQPTTSKRRGARYCEGWGADNPHAPKAPYACHMCE